MNPCGEWRENSSICNLRTKWWDAVSFTPVTIGQEAVCTPQPAWTLQQRAKVVPLLVLGYWSLTCGYSLYWATPVKKKGKWRMWGSHSDWQWSHLKIKRRFGGIYHLYLQSRGISSACRLLSLWFLQLILRPWRWKRYVPPKRRLTFSTDYMALHRRRYYFSKEKWVCNLNIIPWCRNQIAALCVPCVPLFSCLNWQKGPVAT
jgi:hypothetical protein